MTSPVHIDETVPRPVVAGTDIKVAQIALENEHLGMTPADIVVEAHPHLTLADVHAALAYYYDHVFVRRFLKAKRSSAVTWPRERNPAVIRIAKARAMSRGALKCLACGFDFQKRYGQVGHGFIEGHHTIPVKDLRPGAETRVTDIALVCANCHRMLHRKRPWLTMGQLNALIAGEAAI